MENKIYTCLIIGSGPCGIGAAISLKQSGLEDFAIIEKSTPGGKVNIAPRVDNYPGFKKIPGPDLAYELYKRTLDNKVNFIFDDVLSLTKEDDLFKIEGNDDTYFAKFVIIASGTKERKLGLAKEDEFLGKGISYCALCDGHFFKGKDIAIVGGGNSALKEAIHLAHIGKKITLIHRRNEFRGNEKLIDELKEFPHVEILTPYIPLEILGEEKVEGLLIENKETGAHVTVPCEGFFPLVGQIPNSQFVKIPGVVDEWGTIPADKTGQTSVENLYAGGDILPRPIRQIYLAEHDGKIIAKSILNKLGL
jgi:thioredoxin reductase (NADPH)